MALVKVREMSEYLTLLYYYKLESVLRTYLSDSIQIFSFTASFKRTHSMQLINRFLKFAVSLQKRTLHSKLGLKPVILKEEGQIVDKCGAS